MATTTLTNLRTNFFKSHFRRTTATVSDSATTNTTVLRILDSTVGNGDAVQYRNDWRYVRVNADGTAGNIGLMREILSQTYTSPNLDITIMGPLSGDPTGTITIELTTHVSATEFANAVNGARIDAFERLHDVVADETLTLQQGVRRYYLPTTIVKKPHRILVEDPQSTAVMGNLLENADWETWTDASTPAEWVGTNVTFTKLERTRTAGDTPATLAGVSDQALSYPKHGQYCAEVLCGASAGSVTQDIFSARGQEVRGRTISFGGWAYCRTASLIRPYLYDGVAAYGPYHQGHGWEFIAGRYLVRAITGSPSVITVGFDIASNAARQSVLIDDCFAVVGEYIPDRAWIPLHEGEDYDIANASPGTTLGTANVDEVMIEFKRTPLAMRQLRIEGLGYLSSVSAETDTMEVGTGEEDLLYDLTAARLYDMLASRTSGSAQDQFRQEADFYRGRALSHQQLGKTLKAGRLITP